MEVHQLSLQTVKGVGVRVKITQFTPIEISRAAILGGMYKMLVHRYGTISLEDFAKFRAEVEAKAGLNDEGLEPVLNVCPACRRHGSIKTCAGETRVFKTFEDMKMVLVDLVRCSLITADEARKLETQAREQMPEMLENVGNLSDMLQSMSLGDGGRCNHDMQESDKGE